MLRVVLLFIPGVILKVASPSAPNAAKDLSEALFTLERKSAELKQVREDLAKAQSSYEEEMARTGRGNFTRGGGRDRC